MPENETQVPEVVKAPAKKKEGFSPFSFFNSLTGGDDGEDFPEVDGELDTAALAASLAGEAPGLGGMFAMAGIAEEAKRFVGLDPEQMAVEFPEVMQGVNKFGAILSEFVSEAVAKGVAQALAAGKDAHDKANS